MLPYTRTTKEITKHILFITQFNFEIEFLRVK